MSKGHVLLRLAAFGLALVLAACGSGRGGGAGGYYKDDGPPDRVPANIDSIPDAVPRIEPLASGPNRPYTALGQRFVPDTSGRPYRARGIASWYGKRYHGKPTSNGERYDMLAMTAAHPTLPIPSYARVTSVANGRSVIVRINDRGPFLRERVIDLSYVAAHRLRIVGSGSGEVIVEWITPDQIRAGTWQRETNPASAVVARAAASPRPSSSADASGVGTSNSGGVFLQIGAFREAANARSYAARVAGSMPSNHPILVDESSPDVFRVRIGPFASREDAMKAIEPIEQVIGVTPTVSLP